MNKIRGSIIAKVIAWILFLAGVQNSVLFGICTVLGMGYGYYGMDVDEAWRVADVRGIGGDEQYLFFYKGVGVVGKVEYGCKIGFHLHEVARYRRVGRGEQ